MFITHIHNPRCLYVCLRKIQDFDLLTSFIIHIVQSMIDNISICMSLIKVTLYDAVKMTFVTVVEYSTTMAHRC